MHSSQRRGSGEEGQTDASSVHGAPTGTGQVPPSGRARPVLGTNSCVGRDEGKMQQTPCRTIQTTRGGSARGQQSSISGIVARIPHTYYTVNPCGCNCIVPRKESFTRPGEMTNALEIANIALIHQRDTTTWIQGSVPSHWDQGTFTGPTWEQGL